MNKIITITLISFLLLFLFGCTQTDLTIPFTTSQLIAQSTDLNYTLFTQGYYDGNFLTIDENKLSVSVIDFNEEEIPWSSLIDFPSGCAENQAVKIIDSSLVCVDLPTDTNFQTSGLTIQDINQQDTNYETAGYDFSDYLLEADTNRTVNVTVENYNEKSLYFDDVADYVDTRIGEIETQGKGFSITAWVKPTDLTTQFVIASKSDESPQSRTFNFRILETGNANGDQVLNFWTSYDESNVDLCYGTTTLNENTTYFVTADHNTTHNKIYLNGELENTCATTGKVVDVSSGNILLGAYDSTNPSTSYTEGYLDELMIFDVSLEPEQIQEIYNNGNGIYTGAHKFGLGGQLRAYYHFDDDLSNYVLYARGIGAAKTGTVYGDPLVDLPSGTQELTVWKYADVEEDYEKYSSKVLVHGDEGVFHKFVGDSVNFDNTTVIFGVEDVEDNYMALRWVKDQDYGNLGYPMNGLLLGDNPTEGNREEGLTEYADHSAHFFFDQQRGSFALSGTVPTIRQFIQRESGGIAFELFNLIGLSRDTGLNTEIGSIGYRGLLEGGDDGEPETDMLGFSTKKPADQWYDKFELAISPTATFVNPYQDDILDEARSSNYKGLQVWDGGIVSRKSSSAVNPTIEIKSDGDAEFKVTDSGSNRARLGVGNYGGYFQVLDNSGTSGSLIRSYNIGGVQAYFMAGDIGIGTQDPEATLDIRDTGNLLNIVDTEDEKGITINTDSERASIIGYDSINSQYNDLVFRVGIDTQLELSTDGNIRFPQDELKTIYGADDDASIEWNGTDMEFNSDGNYHFKDGAGGYSTLHAHDFITHSFEPSSSNTLEGIGDNEKYVVREVFYPYKKEVIVDKNVCEEKKDYVVVVEEVCFDVNELEKYNCRTEVVENKEDVVCDIREVTKNVCKDVEREKEIDYVDCEIKKVVELKTDLLRPVVLEGESYGQLVKDMQNALGNIDEAVNVSNGTVDTNNLLAENIYTKSKVISSSENYVEKLIGGKIDKKETHFAYNVDLNGLSMEDRIVALEGAVLQLTQELCVVGKKKYSWCGK